MAERPHPTLPRRWRARPLEDRRLIAYTLASEPGSSLRAAGWRPTGQIAPPSWSYPS